jgi:outer membrane lipoprotein-sorting protein
VALCGDTTTWRAGGVDRGIGPCRLGPARLLGEGRIGLAIESPAPFAMGGDKMRNRSVHRMLAAAGLTLAFVLPAAAQEAKKSPVAPATTAPAPAAPAAPAPGAGATGQAWPAQVQTGTGTDARVFDANQVATIKKVTDYFNALNNLKGAFQQTNPDGKRVRGSLYVKKPGRFRFDYNKPSRQIVISDGKMLAVQDTDVNSDDRYELDNTPFRMLLRKDVDLMRDARILDVQEAEDLIIITVMDKSPDAPGKIKLFFAVKPALELKEWVTTDAQNVDTRVELSAINRTDEVDAGLFDIKSVALRKFQQ